MKLSLSILCLLCFALIYCQGVQGILETNGVVWLRWSGGVTNEVMVAYTNMPAPSTPRPVKGVSGSLVTAKEEPIVMRVTYYDELTGEPYTTVEITGTRKAGFQKSEIIKK